MIGKLVLVGILLSTQYTFPPLPTQPKSGGDQSGREEIGKHRPLPASAMKKGRWTRLDDGRRVWRLSIRSPGAVGMRVHFTQFAVGSGKVSLYAGQAGEVRGGPYTGTGIDETGAFWSDTIFSDTVTVEYEAPSGAPGAARPPFQISEISHLFK
jgi:hypothetical protein